MGCDLIVISLVRCKMPLVPRTHVARAAVVQTNAVVPSQHHSGLYTCAVGKLVQQFCCHPVIVIVCTLLHSGSLFQDTWGLDTTVILIPDTTVILSGCFVFQT